MNAKQKARKITRVSIMCLQDNYDVYITRGNRKTSKHYIKPARHDVFDMLSNISNGSKDQFNTTISISVFPIISITRK